jgi:hypothetical protein
MKRRKYVYNTAIILSILRLFFQSTLFGLLVLMFIPIPWLPNSTEEAQIFDKNPYLVEIGYLISFMIGFLIVLSIFDIVANIYLKRNTNRISKVLSILMIVSPSAFIFYITILILYSAGFNSLEVNSSGISEASVISGILLFSIIPILSLLLTIVIALIQNGIVLKDDSEVGSFVE